MSDQLTIVLTLKDRSNFTYRWMEYMNDIFCPFKILVADGGEDQALEKNLSEYSNYPNINYEYIRYPYDASIDVFYNKVQNVIDKVNTPYLLLADNDDFFVFDRIDDIFDILEKDSEVVGCRGGLVNFRLYGGKDDSIGAYYRAHSNEMIPSIDFSLATKRIKYFNENISKYDYYSNWYCVFRTTAFRDTWKNIMALEVKDVIVVEMLTHMHLLNKGKIIILPFMYYIRQTSSLQHGAELTANNEFLERCVLENTLSDFKLSIDADMRNLSSSDRGGVLKSIACWLRTFLYNLHSSDAVFTRSYLRRVYSTLDHIPYIGGLLYKINIGLSNVVGKVRRRKVVRLNRYEKYFIKSE